MSARKTLGDAISIANTRNGYCLSKKYYDCKTKLKWKCCKNHIWNATLDNITLGTWCPKCANNQKFTINIVKEKIEAKGYKLISKVYVNNCSLIKVRCPENHIWSVRLSDFARQNCPECDKKIMRARYAHKYDFIDKEIVKRNGKLLSKEYTNARTPIKIKCLKCKNIWENRFDNIRIGQWCPRCAVNKTQGKLLELLQDIFKDYSIEPNYKKFKWLRNKDTNYLLEIDIFIYNKDKTFTLAIEYDGEQHFKPVRFGGITHEAAKQNLITQKKRDKLKNKLIRSHKKDIKHFVRFSYKDVIDLDTVNNRLSINNIV